jgi:hypothetical protein
MMFTKALRPDDVCVKFAQKSVRISVTELDDDLILFEGTGEALKFMAALFTAMATDPDCGFQIGPRHAGRALFAKGSTRGLYIHRVERAGSRTCATPAKATRRVRRRPRA